MQARSAVKKVVKSAFLLLALPLYLAFRLLCLAGSTDGCFASFSQAISLVPGKAGVYLRAAFYRLACPGTSDEISVGFLTVFSHRNTTVRKGVYIGPQCNIGMCEIGENTLLGSGVHILSGKNQHHFSDASRPIQEQGGKFDKIQIGDDCWIGNSAIIMANLEAQTIVAAGGVVTKRPEPGAIVAGNPARKIASRFASAENPKDSAPILNDTTN